MNKFDQYRAATMELLFHTKRLQRNTSIVTTENVDALTTEIQIINEGFKKARVFSTWNVENVALTPEHDRLAALINVMDHMNFLYDQQTVKESLKQSLLEVSNFVKREISSIEEANELIRRFTQKF